MIHLTTLAWTQVYLIETGVFSLIVALSTHVRRTLAYRRSENGGKEDENVPEETEEPQKPQRAAQNLASWSPVEHRAQENPGLARAGDLLKTAKVGFVQKFK